MRLIACQNCHTQYDVTEVVEERFDCRCGETVENKPLKGVDLEIHRCGSCGAHVASGSSGCDFCGSAIARDSRNLSLICPECHGRNEDDSRFCTACGVNFSPEAVKIEGFELPCPACGALMPPRSIGGVGINECPGCNGIWAPGDRLDHLIARAIEARKSDCGTFVNPATPRVKGGNPASMSVQYRKCPECEAFMQRRNFRRSSGVIIDRCNTHGVWLDADELEQITGFVLSGGNPMATKMLEEADQEARKAAAGAAFAKVAGASEWSSSMRSTRGSRNGDGGLVGTLFGVLESLLK